MSLRKRILRLFLMLLLAGLFGGYFAFSTFLFSPLESGIDGDIASLAPRDVDFFVAKADLSGHFDDFPRLAVIDELEQHSAWQTFLASPEYTDLLGGLGIDETVAQLSDIQAQVPAGMPLLSIFGGSDVSLAGYLRGAKLADSDWAIYGRLNWVGKLGISLLSYPGVLGLEEQGLTVEVGENHVTLTGGQLPRPLYITRIRNIGVVASSAALVEAAVDLEARKGQDSFGQSARYHDYIVNANRGPLRDEFEVFFDVRKFLETTGSKGAWPDVNSQFFGPAFTGRFFQLGSLNDIEGVVGFDEGLNVDLHGAFSSELISSMQNRLYRQRGVDRAGLLDDVAKIVPADACLFVFLSGNIGDLLRQVLDSIEKDMRGNIEDAFRSTGKYQSLDEVVSEIESSLKNRLVLIVRPNDYPDDESGPPHNGAPVFAVAMVTWTENRNKIFALRDSIGMGRQFGLQGRNPGDPGFFKNTTKEGGFETREYWSQMIPGTGVIATTTAVYHTIVANHFHMLDHLLQTYTQKDRHPRLADRPDFRALVNSSLPEANLVVWVNPTSAAETLHKQARTRAEDSISIDWRIERARAEDRVIKEHYPTERRGRLSPEIQAEVDRLVEPALESLEQRVRAEQIPNLIAEQERMIAYSQAMRATLLMLALDPKAFNLSIRMVVPLEEQTN